MEPHAISDEVLVRALQHPRRRQYPASIDTQGAHGFRRPPRKAAIAWSLLGTASALTNLILLGSITVAVCTWAAQETRCRQRSKVRPMRGSKTRPPVRCCSVCRVLGSDAGQGVDAAVAQPVAGASEGQDVGVVDDAIDHC